MLCVSGLGESKSSNIESQDEQDGKLFDIIYGKKISMLIKRDAPMVISTF